MAEQRSVLGNVSDGGTKVSLGDKSDVGTKVSLRERQGKSIILGKSHRQRHKGTSWREVSNNNLMARRREY
jgi:hypothetical protein